MFRVKGRLIIAPSAAHDHWFRRALPQVVSAWRRPPITVPVRVAAIFHRADRRRIDLVNAMQALADLLERAGVILNDSLVASWDGSRIRIDRERPRVEVEITTLPEEARRDQ